jgi:phosphomannomutase
LTLEAKQTGALLGIESSGHLIIPEYFLFDDALVIPLKIAQILDNVKRPLHDLVMETPSYPTTKEEIECADEIKFDVIQQLKQELSKEYDQVNTMDGIRVDFPDGWVLIRASNTSPIIRLTAEADTTAILQDLSTRFMKKTQEMIQQTKTTP